MKVNSAEWNRVFPAYARARRKDLVDVINTKLLYVARGALFRTPKADVAAMQAVLGPVAMTMSHQKIRITKTKGVKQGKVVWKNVFAQAAGREVPRLALIINARRKAKGREPLPLHGEEMDRAMNKEWNRRKRSVAFLKSGWIPSIRLLTPLALPGRKPPVDRGARQYGKPKGMAVAAGRSGARPVGRIENFANAKGDDDNALQTYGMPALQAAFDAEAASMREYLARKLEQSARGLGIRTR
jgi:hypothetical protein